MISVARHNIYEKSFSASCDLTENILCFDSIVITLNVSDCCLVKFEL